MLYRNINGFAWYCYWIYKCFINRYWGLPTPFMPDNDYRAEEIYSARMLMTKFVQRLSHLFGRKL